VALARLAALTFPLACPPHTTDAAKAAHIARYLGEDSFRRYLADEARALFVAQTDTDLVGYTMRVEGEPDDRDVAGAVTTRPTAELSKVYVHPDHHGAGVAGALVAATIDEASRRGAASVWLGVNQENVRANRFYEKSGFTLVGTKRFEVGGRYEDDFVRERVLDAP
jgi:ribosomal protein S18 acetylase RimI-like enzyme